MHVTYARPPVRSLRRVATARLCAVLALLAVTTSGCGLAAGLLVGVITDAIEGDGDDGGDPTILLVRNDAASLDAIVEIQIARADGTHAPYAYGVNTTPGSLASLKDVFLAGPHHVRVAYASGWRSRAVSVTIVKDHTVEVAFAHRAPDLAPLAGTWYGGAETSAGVSHTYALTLDASGGASARTIDGVDGAVTGTLAETSEGTYRVSWSDSTLTALITDATHVHAGLVSDDGTVGALEKGAITLAPDATLADAVGAWTGTQVVLLGATLRPADLDAASATVAADGSFDGSDGDGDGVSGVTPLAVTSAAHLRLEADAETDAATPVALSLELWLTADRTFAFVVLAPAAGGTFPDVGRFQLLAKAP